MQHGMRLATTCDQHTACGLQATPTSHRVRAVSPCVQQKRHVGNEPLRAVQGWRGQLPSCAASHSSPQPHHHTRAPPLDNNRWPSPAARAISTARGQQQVRPTCLAQLAGVVRPASSHAASGLGAASEPCDQREPVRSVRPAASNSLRGHRSSRPAAAYAATFTMRAATRASSHVCGLQQRWATEFLVLRVRVSVERADRT
ncbi:hypothetical protein Dimus_013551, partial [Dionaea muscipula]